jgi:hypothetical protein
MRQPIDLDTRAAHALKLADNATIKTKEPHINEPAVEVKPTRSQKKEVVAKSEPIDLLSNLTGSKDNKFSKNSKITKMFNLRLNLYEKSAIYICSVQSGKSMTKVIEEETLSNIIKQAEIAGLTEEQAKILVEQGIVK